MGSDLPKVLLPVAGRPMLLWVVEACRQAGVERCVIVVGYKADQVRDALAGAEDCEFVLQSEQLGTGHAVQMSEPLFADQPATDTFILAGDGPLLRPQTLSRLLEVHREQKAAATLATAVLDDPTGYGRVVRDGSNNFEAIVEHKDATPEQLALREVNPSYYCVGSDVLFTALKQVDNDNQQQEYYLTDVPGLLKRQGRHVAVVDAVPAEDVLSINTPQHLEAVSQIMEQRLASCAGQEGGRA
jgi:bifunctional UDP-N-acetylglucosamine pyrophosphorylase/glucosamine-1-phosphate N-acetyltransferase